MIASFRLLNGSPSISMVQIQSNSNLKISYNSEGRTTLRYHKVSKPKKEELIRVVLQQGKSIVEAARRLKINYSTAKSIILNRKKKVELEASQSNGCLCEGKEGNSTLCNSSVLSLST